MLSIKQYLLVDIILGPSLQHGQFCNFKPDMRLSVVLGLRYIVSCPFQNIISGFTQYIVAPNI